MIKHHYDIIVLGESLAARLAAAQLARGGQRLLLLRAAAPAPLPVWCHASLHLEHFLEIFGGRSCFQPTPPFQVITSDTRLEFHGRNSLQNELRREFGAQKALVAERLLITLKDSGERLEAALAASAGLPLLGLKSRLRFALQTLRRGLKGSRLRRPMREFLSPLGEGAPFQACITLFSGLSGRPAQDLSFAEAALLWSSASRIESVSIDHLDAFVEKRFSQFHGQEENLSQVQSINLQENRAIELTLKNGSKCGADTLIIGDVRRAIPFLQGIQKPLPQAQAANRATVAIRSGTCSPLLAQGVLLEGNPALRLTLASGAANEVIVECCAAAEPDQPEPGDILQNLQGILPFTQLALLPGSPNPSTAAATLPTKVAKPAKGIFAGGAGPLNIGKNLLFCDGRSALPSLGVTGEALLGTTIANHLLGTKGRT